MADAARAPRGVFDEGGRAAARDALLGATLAQAVDTLRARLGADPAGWMLGQPRYHHTAIPHPLGGEYDVGTLPRGGSANTLNATGDTDRQGHGASLRVVVDLADWDRSVGTNTPGQSGDPRSPFYRNLFAGWAAGRYFPLPYTTGAVDAAAVRREVLRP
ncbi:penicillin acylase family protein [Roseisolibacter sp. H3M3-2]|uniref:penicillin acylase family protein n=1 Tax=Roseisolibacter sp. H3M3-2 TaxID=3031323 RepID=UPI0023D9F54C|nr:penicillin acylase family protein [Roseisolibacter sp. H3M3-2]MDF1506284.1 penicillin acylase family protein [Roseisolibacter sp. H3M3-2]